MGKTKTKSRSEKEKHNKMKVIFQFPTKSTEDEKIRKEVNGIMACALREQMQKLL